MLDGPDSQEADEDKECVITPSTSVKSLRERNRINFMRNYLLLIGTTSVYKSHITIHSWNSWNLVTTLITLNCQKD